MSHTPGPWNEHEGFIIGRFKSDNEIHDICDPRCAPVDADTICEMDANARLIAAAPELLQALRCALADLEGSLDDYEEHDWDAHVKSIKEARLAISKATGEKFHQTTPFGKY